MATQVSALQEVASLKGQVDKAAEGKVEEAKYKHLLASLQHVEAQSASYAAQLQELKVHLVWLVSRLPSAYRSGVSNGLCLDYLLLIDLGCLMGGV
jgi:hypothetical protein